MLSKEQIDGIWETFAGDDGFVRQTQRMEFAQAIEVALRAQADARPVVAQQMPTPDELRAIAREARNTAAPSDEPARETYVLAGWRAAMAAHPEASAPGLSDEQREKVHDAVRDALGTAYDCLRVWEAWSVGTMSQDDFALVAEDDSRVAEIADAAIDALTRASAATVAEPSEYSDSTPHLHVGDSKFEPWFSDYSPAGKGTKQQMRDAYAAGMGDPLVKAAQQRADPRNEARHRFDETTERLLKEQSGFAAEVAKIGKQAEPCAEEAMCPSCYYGESKESCVGKQAEPGSDEREAHLDLLQDVLDAKAIMLKAGCKQDAFAAMFAEYAAQSGQRGTPEQILTERQLTCEAIDGAIAFGYQNTNPPPSDEHWLAPFWKIGRKQSELEQSGQRATSTSDDLWNEKLILKIVEELNIMFASAQCEVDESDGITGYRVKTGALHRMVGALAGIGQSVSIPVNMPVSGQRAGVADEVIERLALKHIAPHAKKFFPEDDYKASEQFRRVKAYTLELLSEAK